MAMFNFLKKFLKREEEPEIEEVSIYLEDAEQWLTDNSSHTEHSNEDSFEKYNAELQNGVMVCQQNLNVLAQATLRNADIPLREKQIMEGNRTNYINQTRSFLTLFSLPALDYVSLKKAYKEYHVKVSEYTSSTTKAFSVLQHFFAHETRNVSLAVKKLDEVMQQLKASLDANNVELINASRDGLKKVKEHLLTCEYITLKIREIEEQRQKEKKVREDYSTKIEKLKQSNKFSQYTSVIEKRDEITQQFRESRTKLEYVFSVLQKALSKYAHDSLHEKLIKQYTFDPVAALLDDHELEIVPVLSKLKDAVESGKVELKEQKKVKTLKALGALQREKLVKFTSLLLDLKNKKAEQDRNVRGNVTMQEYNDLKYKHDHYEDRIRKHEHNIKQLQDKFAEMDITVLKSEIEEQLLNCTGKQVTLNLDKKPVVQENTDEEDLEIYTEAKPEEAAELEVDDKKDTSDDEEGDVIEKDLS